MRITICFISIAFSFFFLFLLCAVSKNNIFNGCDMDFFFVVFDGEEKLSPSCGWYECSVQRCSRYY